MYKKIFQITLLAACLGGIGQQQVLAAKSQADCKKDCLRFKTILRGVCIAYSNRTHDAKKAKECTGYITDMLDDCNNACNFAPK